MALVSDPASAAAAVQIGAHGILNKPIVPEQVKETLATIRDLIASRENGGVVPRPTAKPEPPRIQRNDPLEPTNQETAPPTKSTGEKQRLLSRKPRELPSLAPLSETQEQVEHQKGTVFSSSPADSPEPRARKAPAKRPRKLGKRIAVVVVLVLAAALAYVWAPGSSYVERLGALTKRVFIKEVPQQSAQSAGDGLAIPDAGNSSDSGAQMIQGHTPAPPAGEESSDDSSNIQVIPVMNSSDGSSSRTTVAQPASSEAQGQPQETQGETAAPPSPTVSNSTPSSPPSVRPVARSPRPSTTVGQSGAQLPQSLNLSNPINPVQTAAAPVFSGALTPVVIPEDTAKQLLVNAVPPSYPEEALRAGLQGAVLLQAVIARDGSVRDVTLVRGSFVFARAAVEAVKQWQYKPYTLNGQAVEAQTLVTVHFHLPAAVPISDKSSAGSAPAQESSKP